MAPYRTAPSRSKYNYTEETLTGQLSCPHCDGKFKPQGFKKHEATCRKHVDIEREQEAFGLEYQRDQQQARRKARKVTRLPETIAGPSQSASNADLSAPADPMDLDDLEAYHGNESVNIPVFSQLPSVEPGPLASIQWPLEFKTEYHPSSGHEPLFQAFNEFHSHIDGLLSLIACIVKGQIKIMLKNDADFRNVLHSATTQVTPFTKHEITVPYKQEERVYEVHALPIWEWALNLLENPLLVLHFIWDAQCVYKHNGMGFERFYDEPWTGDQWWDVQSGLPHGLVAAPLCFILYADKTRLSSHGTVKGYPVVVHCANLLVGIQNGEGIGSGRVVGLLPIVSEDASEEGKTGFTNLKRVIWHESFVKFLELVVQYSKTGYSYKCFDQIICWLFPILLILSADYEEQCMMSLIRGHHSKCPCPVYIKHLLNELKKILKFLEREAELSFEEEVANFPQWCKCNHFNTIIHMSFSDGNKMQDLSRQSLYSAMNILKQTDSPDGCRLLRVISSYLQLDSYIGFDMHTASTLDAIETELLVFNDALKDYAQCAAESSIEDLRLDWDFPKTHLWKHVTRDIRMKGTACNYSTHPNEKLHGPLKDAYKCQSNGKNVAEQILCVNQNKFAISLLRGRVNTFDKQHNLEDDEADDLDAVAEENPAVAQGHIKLGSPQ
ncbi:hypothetical protein DFH29DRAFT_876568 [Suillus ampliporus]|nr:hypothetical protein DFH29DRAFT_876568 [Suillus ampliporus]